MQRTNDDDVVVGESGMAGGPGLKSSNKTAPEGLIGPPEIGKKKSVVVLSSKHVEKSKKDIVTTLPKKIIVRDLYNVMKADPRLVHRPLVY